MTWPHPLTHPSTQPPTHPPMGGGVSTNDKSSNRIELSWFIKFLVIWPDPTHQPTHPPNHTPIHESGILDRFRIFKWNWNILISSSVIEFLLILGVPSWGGRWVDGWGWICLCGGIPCMHICICMLNMINMDASMLVAICNFYTCIHVHACVHACACV